MADHRAPPPSCERRRILLRWLQLLDDLAHLTEAVEAAPDGVFTDGERREALLGLGNLAWDGLANHRPRLPETPRGRVRAPEPDLPDALRHARNSERDAYRILRDAGPLRPMAILREYRRRFGEEMGERTLYHALRALVAAGVVWHRGRDYGCH